MVFIHPAPAFIPAGDFVAAPSASPALWFLFRGDGLVVAEEEGRVQMLPATTPDALELQPRRLHHLGSLSGVDCYAGELAADESLPGGLSSVNVRTLFGRIDDDVFGVAGTALQVISWDRSHRYCGRCGTEIRRMTGERAKICTACGLTNHPRISPAAIVAVIRDGKILLGRSGRYPNQRLFSVLAGYVELGETLEQCVHREVMEEAGVRIRQLNYFGSQPWPYSGSLMVAFTAAWDGGEISVDGDEILEADWFGPSELPLVPGWGSVAGQLIDWFRQTYG